MLQREYAWCESNNVAPLRSPESHGDSLYTEDGNKVEEMPLDGHARLRATRSGHKNKQKSCYAINVIQATVQARSGLG